MLSSICNGPLDAKHRNCSRQVGFPQWDKKKYSNKNSQWENNFKKAKSKKPAKMRTSGSFGNEADVNDNDTDKGKSSDVRATVD